MSIKINIFMLNKKNELLLFYDDDAHRWIIPYSYSSIENTQFIFDEEYNINFDIKECISNNYICLVTNSFLHMEHNKKKHWFKYHEIVFLETYKNHEKIIENIYRNLKLIIILDIDLTLLETSKNEKFSIKKQPNYIIEIDDKEYNIWLRPHLKYFLETISKFVEVIYWTAGLQFFQEKVLRITGLNKYCSEVYYRDKCSFIDNKYVKKLDFMDMDLNKTLLIDDNPIHKTQNPHNCLIISSWGPHTHKEKYIDINLHFEDLELIKLIDKIKNISNDIVHNNYTLKEIEI
jgi:TFIIF-interacting CTD phosphatase-like protein